MLASENVAIAEYCRCALLASGTAPSPRADFTSTAVTTGRNFAATVRLAVNVTEQLVPAVVVQPVQLMNSPCGDGDGIACSSTGTP